MHPGSEPFPDESFVIQPDYDRKIKSASKSERRAVITAARFRSRR
jgi:hypothetical protein